MNTSIGMGRSAALKISAATALLAIAASGCVGAPDDSANAAPGQAEALEQQGFCPDNGSGLLVIDYGSVPSDWDAIIAKKPSFVVLGDARGALDRPTPAYFHDRDAAIRVISYIPMNYAHTTGDDWLSACPKDYTVHHQCDNTPASFDCTQMSIAARIQNAMDSGYDGVFFDETPTDAATLDYVHDCAARVKGYGRDRLVIMNPGQLPPKAMFNADVDIVSVEHQSGSTSTIASYELEPWRWLSVEDGVGDLATAKQRFDSFRSAGGYWYDGTTQYYEVPSWFGDLADYIKSNAPSNVCGGSAQTGPVELTVRSFDLDHGNAELTGLWTVVTDGNGGQITGFSPYKQVVSAGEYQVFVGDYQNLRFDHWDNGSTSPNRSITASSAAVLRAYYHTLP